MVSRFRPLDLNLIFEDRAYELGETINITVDLAPRTNVAVREGRIDLVCEERYQQTYKVPTIKERRHIFKPFLMRALKSDNPGPRRGTIQVPSYFFDEDVTKNRKTSYAHSSVAILSNERLRSGAASSYSAELKIAQEPPQHMLDPAAAKGTVNWMLVATIDVARARDVTESRRIDVCETLGTAGPQEHRSPQEATELPS